MKCGSGVFFHRRPVSIHCKIWLDGYECAVLGRLLEWLSWHWLYDLSTPSLHVLQISRQFICGLVLIFHLSTYHPVLQLFKARSPCKTALSYLIASNLRRGTPQPSVTPRDWCITKIGSFKWLNATHATWKSIGKQREDSFGGDPRRCILRPWEVSWVSYLTFETAFVDSYP